jgi:sterol desaturase/sphingolipid hydroxylase (fatty acid hydroxylase superfamily)
VGGIAFFWMLESAIPLFKFDYKKWKHALPNLFFTGTTILINFTLAFLLLETADWVSEHNFGLINWLPEMPLWLHVVLGIVFLDFFGAYLAHYTEHKIKWMWRIHVVHHSDHKVDTTSANRHHPIESVIRFAFTLLGVFIVGTPIAIVFMYQSISLIFTQFTHANIKIAPKAMHVLSYFMVSPDMHKVHHHHMLPYTDSNYGNIFSIWDRFFGTYLELESQKIVYGVNTFPNEVKNASLKELLKQPFQRHQKPTNV